MARKDKKSTEEYCDRCIYRGSSVCSSCCIYITVDGKRIPANFVMKEDLELLSERRYIDEMGEGCAQLIQRYLDARVAIPYEIYVKYNVRTEVSRKKVSYGTQEGVL